MSSLVICRLALRICSSARSARHCSSFSATRCPLVARCEGGVQKWKTEYGFVEGKKRFQLCFVRNLARRRSTNTASADAFRGMAKRGMARRGRRWGNRPAPLSISPFQNKQNRSARSSMRLLIAAHGLTFHHLGAVALDLVVALASPAFTRLKLRE
jgi:hypothetical protein